MSALSGDDWYYMCADLTCKNYGTDKCWGSYGCPNYEKIEEEGKKNGIKRIERKNRSRL